MKRGTAAKVILGKDTIMDVPAGIVFGTDVILGGKAGLINDFNGLVLSNNVLLGKKISHSTIISVIVRGQSPLVLPDAIADSLSYVKAFGGTEQRNIPDGYLQQEYIYMLDGAYIRIEDLPISAGYKVEFDFQVKTLGTALRNYLGGRANGVSAGGGFRLSKLASGGTNLNRVVMYGFEDGVEYYDPTTQFQANTRYKYTYDNGVCTLESGGSVISTKTFTPTDTTSTDWGINDYTSNGGWSAYHDGMYVYSVKVWNDQNELVMDLVPAIQKGTVPVVGFYDAATGGFRGPTGGTFAADGEAVPTPDAPMDIVSNNGVLKVKDSELPLEYKRLLDISTTGNVFYVSNVYLTGGDTLKFRFVGGTSGNVVGAFNDGAANDNYSFYGSASATGSYARYNGQTGGSGIYTNKIYDITMSPTGVTGVRNPSSFTPTEFTCSIPFCIFATSPTGTPHSDATIYGSVVVTGSQNIKFIPCERVSDGAIGYYETYNGVFLENQGAGTPTTSGYDTSMTQVYADGTVETIQATGKNLFDKDNNLLVGYYIDNTTGELGQSSDGSSSCFLNYLPSSPNVTYTMSSENISQNTVMRMWAYDKDKNPISAVFSSTHVNTSISGTTPAGTAYIRCSFGTIPTYRNNVQLELGSTATTYAPYYDGGTATAEMLLKVGDYQDVQSMIDGVVTRNIGVKALDGTEDWFVVTGYSNLYGLAVADGVFGSNKLPMSTHYQGTTANNASMSDNTVKATTATVLAPNKVSIYIKDGANSTLGNFKQYLAAQYNAGTPVIVIYPLATPTTESVAGQTLQVTNGDNTLEITQASLTGLELEAQYKAAVTLTIQEVQDANLDPNVEVTIQ